MSCWIYFFCACHSKTANCTFCDFGCRWNERDMQKIMLLNSVAPFFVAVLFIFFHKGFCAGVLMDFVFVKYGAGGFADKSML